jgi:hypothetical protein
MKSLLLFCGVLALLFQRTSAVQAQQVLLHNEVAQDTTHPASGPNRAYFGHFYLAYTAVVGRASGPGADLVFGRSGEFALGMRNKFRLSQTLAVGAALSYARLAYHLAQNGQKTVPTTTQYQHERLRFQQLQGEGFVRFNAGRRGNAIGRYLDLTGWGGRVLGSAHYYEDKPAAGSKKRQTTERGLDYVQRWPYGLGVRLGSGRCALIGRYRLSSSFVGAAKARYPEFPRWAVGLELGWF